MSDSWVQVDEGVLTRVDAVAARLGRSREQVVEDSLRRGLAAQTLGDLLDRVRRRSHLAEEQATELAYGELKASRSERRAHG